MAATYRLRIDVMFMIVGLLAATFVVSPTEPAAGNTPGTLTVTYFDVGQAGATLLHDGDTAILIDAGTWQASDLVPYLQAAGVDELDLMVVTHPHADHVGQFDQVLGAFDVAEVWWSGATTTSQTFAAALTALETSDAVYEEPRAGDTATIGQLGIEVVNPPVGANLDNVHDTSLSMRITFGNVRFLFTGDAEATTEARMVTRSAAQLDADVYQVGHHGSSTSTTASFLDAVDPTVAISSAGATNQFGHPAPEVVTRMEDAGVEVFGTDVNGTVTVTTDGSSVTVTPTTGQPFMFTTSGDAVPVLPSNFSDIAGNTHEAAIDAIVDAGITGGFPDGTYRPGENVTRGQMATFLTRSLELPAWRPPPTVDPTLVCVNINTDNVDLLQEIVHIGPDRASQIVSLRPLASVDSLDRVSGIGPARLADIKAEGLAATSCPNGNDNGGSGNRLPFSDIAGTTHEATVLAIVQADITGGFPDGTYRPGADVNRGHMAAFLTRGLNLPPSNRAFPDTVGTTHEAAIGAVLAANITSGFPDGTYRPNEPVTRGQMATFLARALGLI